MNDMHQITEPQQNNKTSNAARAFKAIIKHPTLFISFLTGILFYGGYAYNSAWLRGLGIEETQFPISIDRMLFQGFMSGIETLIKLIIPFFGASVGCFIASIIFVIAFDKLKNKFPKINKLILWFENKFSSISRRSPSLSLANGASLILGSFIALVTSLLCLYLIMLAAITYLLSDRAGREAAKAYIDNCGSKLSKTEVYLADETKVEGCSIICNSGECAYLVGKKTFVLDRQGRTISERKVGKLK